MKIWLGFGDLVLIFPVTLELNISNSSICGEGTCVFSENTIIYSSFNFCLFGKVKVQGNSNCLLLQLVVTRLFFFLKSVFALAHSAGHDEVSHSVAFRLRHQCLTLMPQMKCYRNYLTVFAKVPEECGGSVVECLNLDRWVAGSSLTGGTVLCPLARHLIFCLVQYWFNPRRPVLPLLKKCWLGDNQIKQTKYQFTNFTSFGYTKG